jgi:TonB-linked SusC/RagA family outer membrane protein
MKMGLNSRFKAFLLLLIAIASFSDIGVYAQKSKISVSGTVKDQSGQPIIGARITIAENVTKGTITDVKGEFTLSNVAIGDNLTVSYIGYQKKTVKITGRTKLDIVLEESAEMLNEVVVVGYGQMKKSDLTGSVASVKTEKITDTPANSIESLLQGRIAGVQVINSSQDPGAGSTVRIRGASSLNGSNSPLVVIDGFPYGEAGSLSEINPQDIVSMEVLKDASASAIYGSRGANGVILITTRQAKKNTTRINVIQQTTMSEFGSKLNLWRDPVLMAMLSNESYENAGLTPLYTGSVSASGIYYPSIEELQTTWTTNTKWDDLVFRDVPVSDNTTVQVQSSNDRTTYIASANYYSNNGMYIKDTYKKYGGNFSVEHKITDNLSMKASANITQNKRHYNSGLSYSRNPIYPVYNDDGSYFQYSENDYYNPMAITDLQKIETKGFDLISFASINYQIFPFLNLKAQLNYKHGESTGDYYYPKKYTEVGVRNNGYGKITNSKDDNIVFETYATYDKIFNQLHHFTAMGGYSYEHYQSRGSSLAAKGFLNEALGNEDLEAGDAESYEIGNSLYDTKLVSGLCRLNYSYNDRYLATFTARVDGSSKFGKDNQWAFFPSGAVSWKMHEEEFIKRLGVFDILKLRASYGISGNQGISAYQTLSRYGQHKYYNDGEWKTVIGPGYISGYYGSDSRWKYWSGVANKDLKWETTSQLDFGLDMSFFKGRLNVTFDWYNKHTYDLLQERNITPSSGYDKMWVNNGEIRNRGIELTIDGVAFQNKDWKVDGTFIFSRNRNKVLDLGVAAETGLSTDARTGMLYENYGDANSTFVAYTNILAVGQPMYVFYGYKVNGMVQSYAEGLSAGLSGDFAKPGEYKYVDVNGDGTVDENDRCIIGNPNPDWTASLGIDVKWKRLDFSVFLNGVFGNDVVDMERFNMPNNSPLRWTTDNPTNSYPRLNINRQTKFSDWWIEDGSFVRIQNMTLGYTLPFTIKNSAKSLRVYASVDNLHTFTSFKGYDPEVSVLGVYNGGYPRLRKWTIGASLTF